MISSVLDDLRLKLNFDFQKTPYTHPPAKSYERLMVYLYISQLHVAIETSNLEKEKDP
jgi:hypothetical protein